MKRAPEDNEERRGTSSPEMIFLGTGGARIVVFKQVRASGGIWMSLDGSQIHVDPGPGALVHLTSKRLGLDPTHLSAIVLTHKHLDHSADVNVMIEAMTEGGFHPKGAVLAPQDAYENDGVIFGYLRSYVERMEVLREGSHFQMGGLSIEVPLRLLHPVENYALRFKGGGKTISLISDTRYFPELEEVEGEEDVLLLNVVLLQSREIDHLCLEDAKRIIRARRPKLAILTHFGMTMLRAKPWELAASIEQELGTRVLAAYDHMRLDLDSDEKS
ncbi:MAG: MBL fold metallo-hydrolase [bacterium]|jgi:phosphoribosyl 1,2-cyclic phosphodiesterase